MKENCLPTINLSNAFTDAWYPALDVQPKNCDIIATLSKAGLKKCVVKRDNISRIKAGGTPWESFAAVELTARQRMGTVSEEIRHQRLPNLPLQQRAVHGAAGAAVQLPMQRQIDATPGSALPATTGG
ncbi:MAG: hypothetical protein WB402_04150 [Sulfuricaulis sp.]|uniref:hypothetical protein n=1 Tax=Sulfuricaulis sp. TaxID=2003553 RepID=UPI003C51CA97